MSDLQNVDFGIDSSPPGRHERRRRIVLRLSEGLTPVPKLAKEYKVSKQAIYSMAKRAEKRGEIERIPGLWPNTYRPGPKMAETVIMPHDAKSPPTRTLPVRFHALQAKMPVDLSRANLSEWAPWDTSKGRMARIVLPVQGRRLHAHLRGSAHPILVVDLQPIIVNVDYGEVNALDMHISKAVDFVKLRVSEDTTIASRICREKYGISTTGRATWYRPPEIAIERFPGLPKNARYRISYVWVDNSVGHSEAETDSLPSLHELMSVANRVSLGLSSLSTFAEMPMIETLTSKGPRPDQAKPSVTG